jgi:holo-[acyl-carrier protein] synthase
MIKGYGIDIVEISRIKRLITRYEKQFKEKVFTGPEITYCNAKAAPEIHYAGRWAVKEAFYKALPESCQKHSFWKSIEIIPSGEMSGKPKIRICTDILQEHLEKEEIHSFHLSISHERKYCIASVILE